MQKVGKKSAPIGVAVLVERSLPRRPLATMLAPTPVLKRGGKRKPRKGNPSKGYGERAKWEMSYPL
jgi:hypothetical protein